MPMFLSLFVAFDAKTNNIFNIFFEPNKTSALTLVGPLIAYSFILTILDSVNFHVTVYQMFTKQANSGRLHAFIIISSGYF